MGGMDTVITAAAVFSPNRNEHQQVMCQISSAAEYKKKSN